jgi:hypothetical protein
MLMFKACGERCSTEVGVGEITRIWVLIPDNQGGLGWGLLPSTAEAGDACVLLGSSPHLYVCV